MNAETTVSVLFEAAGITVPPDEFDYFVKVYPALRAGLDALYEVPMTKEEEPQLVFSPYL
ncbi:hypothetical protein GCM10010172_81550 [Paractinoplanes ferrugineus]|uniref:Uncharacterized protein n=1 Tax=Paractinoplanes ferrugineus TaxID=113564 RepID=A0A919J4K4_9ACTN|nr:hypothetical protein [Actinoplanes ferrugineus]GIE10476.1 hypothetical protein Afe05nite_23160 [Actinoplanes ferrugineus]